MNPVVERQWHLRCEGPALTTVRDISPQLASWDKSTHPAQIRLQAYLDHLRQALGPLPDGQGGLAVHMDIDVQDQERMLHHHDLENYLTPVVQRLGPACFTFVSARKRVGGGSELRLSQAQPGPEPAASEGWRAMTHSAGPGAQSKEWKGGIREALKKACPKPLPDGPIEVHQAWRASPKRNWTSLWTMSRQHQQRLPTKDRVSLSAYLPHDSYDPDSKIFIHRDGSLGIGWILGMPDTEVITPEALGDLSGRFGEFFKVLPRNSAVQFILESTRDVTSRLRPWLEGDQKGNPAARELVRGHADHLSGTTIRHGASVFAMRSLRLILTLRIFPKLPPGDAPLRAGYARERSRLQETARAIGSFASSLGMGNRQIDADELIDILYRLLKPSPKPGPRSGPAGPKRQLLDST